MSIFYYSLGTARNIGIEQKRWALLVRDGIAWLLKERNIDGTWGGEDGLDRLVSTNHAIMTLFSVGFTYQSYAVNQGLDFLENIDTEKHISFFWRAGTLLNIPRYQGVVKHDIEYIWKHKRRIGVHRDYPIPFYLLKLLRFVENPADISVDQMEVIKWILEEWDEKSCWYGRTSITSMAVALLYDLEFDHKTQILARCAEFMQEKYSQDKNKCGKFSDNLVDDCFTVYNICERQLLEEHNFAFLRECVTGVTRRIAYSAEKDGSWSSPPPFGGTVGSYCYPTAVAVRAIMSIGNKLDDHFNGEVSALLLDVNLIKYEKHRRSFEMNNPFWGPVGSPKKKNTCFVLMPFSPQKLTEIYQDYIKKPIESRTSLDCRRADDFYRPIQIMKEIWEEINRAQVVLADLTNKNANVFYELGLSHSLGKDVILISQSVDDIPFDLRSVRTIVYVDSPRGYEKLSTDILNALADLGIQVI